ncbi:MAG: hypothetical protein L3J36_02080 [Rhodobacteraceae bacterium]|nr:hypothetical protein [Paracoccaceae bacterium]
MSDTLLTTTSTENLQPLGSPAQRSYELISGTLQDHFGPKHAALIGEPVANEAGNRIDWYGAVDGEAKPLPDLPEADQIALRANLALMLGDISDLAETLAKSDTAEDQRLSEALKNATQVPDDAMIFGVRNKDGEGDGTWSPVLVHWGWVSNEQTSVRGVLSGTAPQRKPAPPPPIVAPAGPVNNGPKVRIWSGLWWWLIVSGWLLLVILLGAILYLVVAPCGVSRFGLVYCPPDAPPAVRGEFEENPVLGNQVARLQRELALLDRSCQPTVPIDPPEPIVPDLPPPPPPPPPPVEESGLNDAQSDLVDRITERGATVGALNFVLEWHGSDDLDLYVTCPSGQTISYRARSACGGALDLDANARRRSLVRDPAENIVFGNPAIGLYKVTVKLYKDRTSGGTKAFRLHVLRRDGTSQSYNGLIPPGAREWTTTISISR